MRIAGRSIGSEQSPYIVAEVSANHGGQLAQALEMIELAAQAGADAIKFQAYEAGTISIASARPEMTIREGLWKGQNLYALYRMTQTPFKWFPELAAKAEAVGVTWFASVFDKTSVDMLMKLDCPAFKIASFELIDLPLIDYVAQTGRPIILSTGMATLEEITEAYSAVDGRTQTCILHCVSGYPTPAAEARLDRLCELKDYYVRVGISDHTVGAEIPVAATALGAVMIEKHFKPQWFRGPDTKFSLAPVQFKAMVGQVRAIWSALQPKTSTVEEPMRAFRRSLWVVDEVEAGEAFSAANVRSIRPGGGLLPKELPAVLGKTAARDIHKGTPLTSDLISLA